MSLFKIKQRLMSTCEKSFKYFPTALTLWRKGSSSLNSEQVEQIYVNSKGLWDSCLLLFHSLSFLSFPMTSLGTIEGLITPFIKDSQVRSESLIAMRNLTVLHKGIQFN